MSRFRVMTFNIRGSEYPDGINSWENRAATNIALIQQATPDIIGFQEFQPGNQASYDRHLPQYAYAIGPLLARENVAEPYYCAIYWLRDRFQCLKEGAFFLSATPDVYSHSWGIAHGRGLHWVHLQDTHGDTECILANTHLPHDSEEGRIRAARLIVQRLSQLSNNQIPVIITADFNTRPTVYQEAWRNLLTDEQKHMLDANWERFGYRNNVYEIFKSSGYIDTYIKAGNKDTPYVTTIHGYLQEDKLLPLNYRIDWILARGNVHRIHYHTCQIITDASPPIFPSDHYPVVAEFDII